MCDISLRMGINSLKMEAVDHLDAFSGPVTDISVPHIHMRSPLSRNGGENTLKKLDFFHQPTITEVTSIPGFTNGGC